MAKNGNEIKSKKGVSDETLRGMMRDQRIANAAVHKAQEENRRLGIPNWYSIDGKIVSDIQLADEKLAKK
jgi:hypothetical protein